MLHDHKGRRAKDGCIDIALVRLLDMCRSHLYQSKLRLGDVFTVGHLAGQDAAAGTRYAVLVK